MVSPMPSCSSTPMRGGGGDDALAAHAGLGEAEVQRVIAARGELAVDRDQVLHAADLGRQDDRSCAAGRSPRPRGAVERRKHHGLAHDLACVAGCGSCAFSSISRASRSWSRLPQFTPMRTGLSLPAGDFDHGRRTARRACPRPTLPGLMRYLSSASAQAGYWLSSLWPLKWKSPISGTVTPSGIEPLADRRHGGGGLLAVDGDPHQLRTRARQRLDLARRSPMSAVSVLVIDCTLPLRPGEAALHQAAGAAAASGRRADRARDPRDRQQRRRAALDPAGHARASSTATPRPTARRQVQRLQHLLPAGRLRHLGRLLRLAVVDIQGRVVALNAGGATGSRLELLPAAGRA
jgi:hypothetical protein